MHFCGLLGLQFEATSDYLKLALCGNTSTFFFLFYEASCLLQLRYCIYKTSIQGVAALHMYGSAFRRFHRTYFTKTVLLVHRSDSDQYRMTS